MKTNGNGSYKNTILSSLSKTELSFLQPHLVAVNLPRRTMLLDAGQKLTHVYFLEEGLASIVVNMKDGNTVEVGVVGREGMVGLPFLLRTEQIPVSTFMQVAGHGYQIEAKKLQAEIDRNGGGLRAKLMHYLQSHLVQASQTAACNRLHEVDERLARWMLICQDRIQSDEINLTHEFLAQMLGTRRSSVTIAAGILQKSGLIEYSRGKVTVRDRAGLEKAACECYRAIQGESERLGLL